MAINASPSELGPDYAEMVLRRLKKLGLPHHSLTVEVTESPAITHAQAEATLAALIEGGVGVAIDDFGTGHTSLELVQRLPLTEVKIDKSLVQDPSQMTDALVRRCIDAARERGAAVVAEGVETQEHFDRALHWGCHRAQGFYFSPALSGDDLEPLLLEVASRSRRS